MSKPTGKLAFAYQTIANLQDRADALRAENERLVNEQLAFADAVAQKIVAKDAQIERLHADYTEACDDAVDVARKLRAAEAELAALKAVTEGVEVVGHRIYWPAIGREPAKARTVDPTEYAVKKPAFHTCVDDLMTVAQHNAIVAEKDHHLQLLGQLLGDCISAAGITRPDAPLSGPELLMFGDDLLTVLTDMRESVADNQQAEREAFEAWVKTFNSMPGALFVDDRGRYVDDWIQCRWLGWQARAALSDPAAGQFKRVSILKQTNVSYSAHSQRNDTSPDISALVEALELMVTTHDEGGWPTATITIARAALATHKAGGGHD